MTRSIASKVAAVLLVCISAGCFNYATFEGCDPEAVGEAFSKSITEYAGHKLDIKPGAEIRRKATGWILPSSSYSWYKVSEGKRGNTTVMVQRKLRPFLSMFCERWESSELMILAATAEKITRQTRGAVVDTSCPLLRKIRPIFPHNTGDKSSAVLTGVTKEQIITALHAAGSFELVPAGFPTGLGYDKTPNGVEGLYSRESGIFFPAVTISAVYYRFTIAAKDSPDGIWILVWGQRTYIPGLFGGRKTETPLDVTLREASLRRTMLYLLLKLPEATITEHPKAVTPQAAERHEDR